MYFPTNTIIAKIKNNLTKLLFNYGSKQVILNEKLSDFLQYKKENLNILNGATQIYPILRDILGEKKVLLPSPTFGEYPRIFKHFLSYADRVGVDYKEIELKSEECEIIVFVNPNNPTGGIIATEWIYNFAAKHYKKSIIIDESFIDFSDQQSIIELLEKKPLDNVIVIKSLSKPLGVPGLRLGYAYSSNQEFNNYLSLKIPIWHTNSIAEYLLEFLPKYQDTIDESYEKTKKDRADFSIKLKDASHIEHVYPSAANFILIKLKKEYSAKRLADVLLSNYNIYIKDTSEKFADGSSYIRLAVRLPEENIFLINAMKEIQEMILA